MTVRTHIFTGASDKQMSPWQRSALGRSVASCHTGPLPPNDGTARRPFVGTACPARSVGRSGRSVAAAPPVPPSRRPSDKRAKGQNGVPGFGTRTTERSRSSVHDDHRSKERSGGQRDYDQTLPTTTTTTTTTTAFIKKRFRKGLFAFGAIDLCYRRCSQKILLRRDRW